MQGRLFSESWFKVADLRVGLLSSVDIQKQYYRDTLWYVIRDRFNNNYFRVTPEAYGFISLLAPEKTVQEVWEECLEAYRENAPSQDEVIGVLSQLHVNSLLYFSNLPNSEFVFERGAEKKQKEMRSKLLSFIAIKIPIWNPDRWLTRVLPYINQLFSYKGLIVWIIALVSGVMAVAGNLDRAYDQTQGMLAPSKLFLLYLSVAFLRLCHEFGHAMMNKRFGGPVHTLGVMFLVFTPFPYMDATSSWFFQRRLHRVLVGSAGVMVELFFAAIAAMVWANTADGLVHAVAFNIMIVGSVTSLFFNGNPLIRYDAYYVLSDVLEIPNLYQRSRSQWFYWGEKHLFGVEDGTTPPAGNRREAVWLAAYAALSLAYRILITVAIILFMADHIFAVGFALGVVSLFTGFFFPLKRFFGYLFKSPKLARTRKRAYAVSAGLAAAVVIFVGFCPFFNSIRAPGVLEAKGFSRVYAETEGRLEEIYQKNGAYVKKGEPIALLSNFELDMEIRAVEAVLAQTKALRQKAIMESSVDLKPLREREGVLSDQLRVLLEKKGKLAVTAVTSGVFVAPDIETLRGMWLKRQTPLGSLVEGGEFRFSGIVSQEQASELFGERKRNAEMKLWGKGAMTFSISDITAIPYQKEELPSAALGWMGGGEIPVSTGEKSGKRVAEPFFEITGKVLVPQGKGHPVLLHGRSGMLRLTLKPEPLAVQAYRLVKQGIQKRYRI